MGIRLLLWTAILGLPILVQGEDLTTLSGQTYSNIVVLRYNQRGIFVQNDGGTNKIPYKEILPELRGYYKKLALSLTPYPLRADVSDSPPGADDLVTRSGEVYRNVVVRSVEQYAIIISHDAGNAKVYFSEIPDKAMRDKYRMATPVPYDPLGSNDLVTVDGQIFRNAQIIRTEPDGLTIRHTGGVTKLAFLSLSEDLRTQYHYDYQAARNYQRSAAEEKKRLQDEAEARSKQQNAAASGDPIALFDVNGTATPDGQFWVRFTVRCLIGKSQAIRAIPYDSRGSALMGGQKFVVPAVSEGKKLDITVPLTQPQKLTIYCGSFQVSRTIKW